MGPQLDIGLLGQRGVATDDVVDVIEAASAFPVAFGMKRLTYCVGGGAWPADDCVKEIRTTARFFDGGLYDNVPIGLAHALLDRKPAPGLSLLYIDPDELRHDVVHAPPGPGARRACQLLELAGGFVTVARKYELQNVARQLGLATNGAVPIDPVNRFSPIMGTHSRSFGAFVARPFRQYDYYVGIYDGLWSLATRVCAVTPQPTNRQKLECVIGEVLRLQKAIGSKTPTRSRCRRTGCCGSSSRRRRPRPCNPRSRQRTSSPRWARAPITSRRSTTSPRASSRQT